MRWATVPIALSISLSPAAAKAQSRSMAVFDFELVDTSRQDQLAPPKAEHQARIALVSGQLRKRLAESGRFTIVDIAPVNAQAHASNLQSCGGCDVRLAGQIWADLAVTGIVYKVSNLILNMIIVVRDVKADTNVAVAQADMRGDTDETWVRTVDWLVRNRLLDPDRGMRPWRRRVSGRLQKETQSAASILLMDGRLPMIAVIFEVWPADGRVNDYLAIAASLRDDLSGIDGFISVERFQSLTDPGKLLSLSFWRDEEAVKRWRNHSKHRESQREGRSKIFRDYRLRIATVARDYGLNERAEAPEDSRVSLGDRIA
jgi:heme-degrading monooxygenase HmoA